MAVSVLISSLVFLHVLLQPASSEDLIDAPKLSVEPWHPEYFEGERIILTCAASYLLNSTVERYRFFDQDGRQIAEMPANPYQKANMIFRVQMDSIRKYSCDYWMETDGKEILSARSNTTSLQVKEAPPPPSLSVDPQRNTYDMGDEVSLVCSAPDKVKEIKEFQFYGDRIGVSAVASYGSIYKYNMTIMEWKDTGLFYCAYAPTLSGRKVLSKRSNSVTVPVKGVRWERLLAVGGSFFTINGLIFLISHWCF